MRRFIITVLIATVLHAIAGILAPPFEFGALKPESRLSEIRAPKERRFLTLPPKLWRNSPVEG
jgi:hypothetical protein